MSEFGESDVLDFWLGAGPERWFKHDASFDGEVRDRLLAANEAAALGKLAAWSGHAEGALALLVLL